MQAQPQKHIKQRVTVRHFLMHLPYMVSLTARIVRRKNLTRKLLGKIYKEVYAGDNDKLLNRAIKRSYYLSYCYPLVYEETFETLTGKKLSSSEKKAGVYASAIAVLFDAIFDDLEFSTEDLFAMIENGGSYQPKEKIDTLVMRLHGLLIQHLAPENMALFNHYVKEVFYAQEYSMKQKENISADEMEHIIAIKGGYSALLFRALLNAPIIEGETEAVFGIGKLMQLLNDVVNSQKDASNGIHTLVTMQPGTDGVVRLYNRIRQETQASIDALDYPAANKKTVAFKLFLLSIWGYTYIKQAKRKYGDAHNKISGSARFAWSIPNLLYAGKILFTYNPENTQVQV